MILRLKLILLWALLMALPSTILAQPSIEFSLSPNADGQIQPSLYSSWDWAPGFRARLDARSENIATYDDASPGIGQEQSITTVNHNVIGEFAPLLMSIQAGTARLGLGVGLGIDYYNIRETGFIDVGTAPIRLFFNNVRKITAYKPMVLASLDLGQRDDAWLGASVGYIPWMPIGLNHDFSSAADGVDYDTPRTIKDFAGSSTNAWNVMLGAGLRLGVLDLSLDSRANGAAYTYEMLLIGGAVGSVATYEYEGSAMLLVSIQGFEIAGLRPQLGIGLVGSSSIDLLDPDAVAVGIWKMKYSFGFKTK